MGRKNGETVDVTTPRGVMKYKIEAINKVAKKTAAKKAREAGEVTEAELIAARRANLAALRSRGADPFARDALRRHRARRRAARRALRAARTEERAEGERTAIAGRVDVAPQRGQDVLRRPRPTAPGSFSSTSRKDERRRATFALFKALDRGDFDRRARLRLPHQDGRADAARRSRSRCSAKALQPLPDKWHGLVDVEKRYRQRYVDLIIERRTCATSSCAQPDRRRDAALHRRARLSRSRDADAAQRRRRRGRAPVPHARQRARHRAWTCGSRPS